MPVLLIVLIAILIAQIGFWDTLGTLIGAVAVLALFWIILIATVVLAGYWLFRRFRAPRP